MKIFKFISILGILLVVLSCKHQGIEQPSYQHSQFSQLFFGKYEMIEVCKDKNSFDTLYVSDKYEITISLGAQSDIKFDFPQHNIYNIKAFVSNDSIFSFPTQSFTTETQTIYLGVGEGKIRNDSIFINYGAASTMSKDVLFESKGKKIIN